MGIKIASGFGSTATGFVLSGAGGVTAAATTQLAAQAVGWISIFFGIGFLAWGVRINEKHLWQRWWLISPQSVVENEEWTLKQVIEHISSTKSISADEAARDLKDKLSGGNLRSRGLWQGRENREQTRRFIQPDEWVSLWFPVDVTVERGTNFVQRMSGELGQYHNVGFESANVRKIWK